MWDDACSSHQQIDIPSLLFPGSLVYVQREVINECLINTLMGCSHHLCLSTIKPMNFLKHRIPVYLSRKFL